MRFAQGKWWVIDNGEWLEFTLTGKDIIWR